jgi:outer membrane autotransporter protein
MTPTVSDAIIINGALTIETGTALEITGERPLTPGVAYDLITTTDGITGTFTTVDKAETVLGFLSYTPTALQLLGTFQLRAEANPQVVATNDYLNSLLIAGTETAGISAAIPDLVDADGFANEAAMATLHPEAYASASQIGVENGLAISSALRTANWAGRNGEAGTFTFGQGFGNWRNFKADAVSGVSKADVRSAGFLGGIGYGSEVVSISAFVGHVDARQQIGSIGARNDADGTFFGASAQLALAGFRLGGSVIHDRSSADTSRSLFDGSEAQSHYRLRGTTADIHAGYGFAIGGGWDVGPEIGVTHVSVKRGAASETGAGPFNLNVT